MFDLGTSFLASVARDPDALAIVDGALRLTYREWHARISSVLAGLDALGLRPGDHLVTVLQNRWEAATLHWACQFAGIIITPVNWRATADDLDFFCEDAEAFVGLLQMVAVERRAAVARYSTGAAADRKARSNSPALRTSSTPSSSRSANDSTSMVEGSR